MKPLHHTLAISQLYPLITLMVALFLFSFSSKALEHTITFSAATPVDSVLVQNLTLGVSVRVPAGNTLRLSDEPNAVYSVEDNDYQIKIYPNPIQGTSTLSFYSPVSGQTRVDVLALDGRRIDGTENNIAAGENLYKLSLPKGAYFIKITGSGFSYAVRVLSQRPNDFTTEISFSGNYGLTTTMQKSPAAFTTLIFNAGDRLLFKGYSGNNSNIITDIPYSDKNIAFTFEECKDALGTYYSTVTIGTQTWMVENLRTTQYMSGEEISELKIDAVWKSAISGAYCDNSNNAEYAKIYGKLYNWYAVNDTRRIAPKGWHVPTADEWKLLEDYLGGLSVAGGKLMSTGTEHWISPYNGASNESGFTAIPAGWRHYEGVSLSPGTQAGWWTSTQTDATHAIARRVVNSSSSVLQDNTREKQFGYAVRCIKDVSVVPALTTVPATSITHESALSGGNIASDGGFDITVRGVCWSTSQHPTVENNKTLDGAGIGVFSSTINNLTASTKYYIRAYATNINGTGYGDELSFTTAMPITAPVLTTTSASSVSSTTATSGGNITSDGGASVTERGVCWSMLANPIVSDNKTSDGTGAGTFTSSITGLLPNTKYYVRAYATNSVGTTYGTPVSFTTITSVATLTTADVSNITQFTAGCGGTVSADGGASVTARGVCWSTSINPTVALTTKTTNGTGRGTFTSSLTGLELGTTYYVRAYATNSKGTAYGNEVSFTTVGPILPTVTTSEVTSITNNSAKSGGNVISDGGATVIATGVCWSTSPNPTSNDNKTNEGSGTGEFSSSLTGLSGCTAYYVRAYATNAAGTGYGNDLIFITASTGTSVVDVLNPVTGKTWMDRNLGACRAAVSSTDEQSFGDLYQWGRGTDGHEKRYSETTTSLSNSDTPGHGNFILSANSPNDWRSPQNDNLWQGVNGKNNPCPTGYRLPTYAELDSEKASWSSQDFVGAFESPLKLPIAGYRDVSDGSLDNIGYYGSYWSGNVGVDFYKGYSWYLTFSNNSAYMHIDLERAYGISVRCIKDIRTDIITNPIVSKSSNSIDCGGSVSNNGGSEITKRGVCWSLKANPTINDSITSEGSGNGIFISTISGLSGCKTYYIRAYATNNEGTAYGSVLSFTSSESNTTIVDVVNPTTGRIWMDRNLGACQAATSSTDILAYGDLYQWGRGNDGHEKRYSITTSSLSITDAPGHGNFIVTGSSPYDWRSTQNDNLWQGVNGKNNPCPPGYRIPTRTEWEMEIASWGSNNPEMAFISSLKLPSSGFRRHNSGYEDEKGYRGYYWSSSVDGSNSWHMGIGGLGAYMNNYQSYRTTGKSVRCIKNSSSNSLPTLTTTAISSISTQSATSGGDITSEGGSSIKYRGVCWNTVSNPTIENNKTSDGSGTGSYSSSMIGLLSSTTYYVRAYATNEDGTAYGNELSFTTNTALLATVSTSNISGIGINSATSGGNVSSDGGVAVTQYGVCWSTSPNPTIVTGSFTNEGSGTGEFSSLMTGLLPGTTYFVRAYAKNSVGVSYGEQKYFNTAATLPIVTTDEITAVTFNTAISGGNVSYDGGATVTERGVCWNTSGSPTISDSKTMNGTETGTFTANLTELTPNTVYFVRAYATNSAGTTYGEEKLLKTEKGAPVIATTSVTNITFVSANAGGEISADGGAAVTARGVCWSTSQNPTVNDSKTIDGTGIGGFNSSITGLTYNTTYYVRAYATNSIGTSYGNEISFKTIVTTPKVETDEPTLITASSVVCGGNVTTDGGAAVTARGVCWSTSQNPTIDGDKTTDGTGTGNFISNITGLTFNTTYYVRAYATNSAGTVYGEEKSFSSMKILPVLTTTAVSDISFRTATSGGEITADGGAPVTERGICWSTNQNPTIIDFKTSDGTQTGVFSSSLSGLTPGTTYYVRAYATNSVGTAYGNQVSLTTSSSSLPVIIVNNVTDITYSTAISGGVISSDGGADITEKGVCWSTSVNPTIANNKTSDGTGQGSYSSTITGLSPITKYYVRAYATNSLGTTYSTQISFTTLAGLPTMTTSDIADISQFTATSGGNISADGGDAVYTRGVCWDINPNPTVALSTKTTDGNGSGFFTSLITGLEVGTSYYVRAYATNNVGTAYGNEVTFTTTGPILPTLTTTDITNISDKGATSGGNIFSNGGATVTQCGVCWSTSPNPTISNSITNEGSGSGAFTSAISGLTGCTIYYVRAYATNVAGTAYGNEITFTSTLTGKTAVVDVINPATGKTWMDRNLGACRAALSSTDFAAFGDLYQWGRDTDGHEKRVSGTTSSLSVTDSPGHGKFIIGNSNWRNPQNDNLWQGENGINNPCPTGYRLPTYAEFDQERATWNSQNSAGAYASFLKLPVAGRRDNNNGLPNGEGTKDNNDSWGVYWSSTVNGNDSWFLDVYSSTAGMHPDSRAIGKSVRCIKEETNCTLPSVTTIPVSSIELNSALSGGNITSDGQATISARGVCWNTMGSPTINDNKTSDGNGTGTYSSSLTQLTSGTKYYLRAYATNSLGTSYGEEISFSTTAFITTVVDVTNPTTGKTWMDRNLGAGREATSSTDADAYGDLYQWGRATDGHEKRTSGTTSTLSSGDTPGHGNFITTGTSPYDWRSPQNTNLWQGASGINNPCLSGYRLPTQAELDAERTSWSSNNAAGAFSSPLKLPVAGYRYYSNGSLIDVGSYGLYWSSTVDGTYSCYLYFYGSSAGMSGSNRANGFSVRCIKELTDVTLPSISTTSISNVLTKSALSGGNITNDGGATILSRGVCWSISPNPTISDYFTLDGTGSDAFTSFITGLKPATTFYVRAYATNGIGIAYGNEFSFTTADDIFITFDAGNDLVGNLSSAVYNESGMKANFSNIESSSIGDPLSHGKDGNKLYFHGSDATVYFRLEDGTKFQLQSFELQTNGGSRTLKTSNGVNRELTHAECFFTGTEYENIEWFSLTTSYQATQIDNICFRRNINSIPSVNTSAIVNNVSTSAISGGFVTSDGGVTITERGVCWSTSPSPTITDSKTTDGTGLGSFASFLTGLTSSTTYYVRAYATNSVGTAYGNEISFLTMPLIGDNFQGGKVAYILQPGDTGYDAKVPHGLIAAPSDQSAGIDLNGARGLCSELVLAGYDDWYLPNTSELNMLYLNRIAIGGFTNTWYWSANEWGNFYFYIQNFTNGEQSYNYMLNQFSVRAVRVF